jgi:uncharacterized protein YjbI with pentapeptide repeats
MRTERLREIASNERSRHSSRARLLAAREDPAVISSDALVLDEGEAVGLRVEGARHAGESFAGARLVDVELVRCDFSGCDFSESVWRSARLVDCRLSAVELTQAKLRDVAFSACRLDDANLRMSTFTGTRFEECDLQGAEIRAATLDTVVFPRSDLRRADLSQVRAKDVDLRGARLDAMKGIGSLRGATIDVEQCVALAPALADALGINVRRDA